MKSFYKATVAASMLAGCQLPPAVEQSRPAFGEWGIDLAAGNVAIRPGDDFEAYANGSWLAETDIPSDQATYSLVDTLSDAVRDQLRTALTTGSSKDAAPNSTREKLLDVYSAWMDEVRLNAIGLAPLQPYLDAIYDQDSYAELLPELASIYGSAPFGLGVIADPANPSRYIAYVVQSGLGMETREYYLAEGPTYIAYRNAYTDYIETVFRLAGYAEPAARARSVLNFETELAKIQWTQADSLVVENIYNPMSLEELQALAPDIDWAFALDRRGLADVKTILVVQPSAIRSGTELMANAPLPILKDYLAFHLLNQFAGDLTTAFDDARHAFHDKTLQGRAEKQPRWSRGIALLSETMGVGLGQLYIESWFPKSSKCVVAGLTDKVIDAFRTRLKSNAWMDEKTRQEALDKLDSVEPRIAYPDNWTDYTSLETNPKNHLENRRTLMAFDWEQDLARLGGPVDRKRWAYPPQTVSAYYDAQVNKITLLAGILQPPFFDPAADAAVNYGGIGAIIGHELGHGFDSTGRMFDGDGVLRDWWTDDADEAFRQREAILIKQYGAYEPIDGVYIDGALTISENIGDLGGLEIAYTAYRQHLDACCDGETPVIDGLTGDQRFFLSWAQIWRGKSGDDALRNQLLTNEHSPFKYRINGVVRNIDAWYEAFDVQPGDALYLPPSARVKIW
ncbi:MAG: M13 family metallopeptidase [Pseudomonadota bacterium]